jgi:catechol 2,3-dioxygenase-like lactoylglutathione lyase family enzyme
MPKPLYDLQIHRTHLLVSDIEHALTVYRDIIGLKVNFLVDSLDVTYDMFDLDRSARCRTSFLSEGKGAFGSIAMTEAKGVAFPTRQKPHRSCVIIEVKEGRLGEIIEGIKALGLDCSPAMDLDNPPRTDWSFTDYDGHRIVMFEIHPKKKRVIGGAGDTTAAG